MEEVNSGLIAIGWWQVGLSAFTLIALIVYAWDTRRLRKAAELQQRDNREQVDILIKQHRILTGQLDESVAPLFRFLECSTPESSIILMTYMNRGGRITALDYRLDNPTVIVSQAPKQVIENGEKFVLGLVSQEPTLQEIKEGRFYMDYTDSLGRRRNQEFYWVWEPKTAGVVAHLG